MAKGKRRRKSGKSKGSKGLATDLTKAISAIRKAKTAIKRKAK